MAKPKRNLGETVKAMQARKQQSGRAPAKTRAVRPTQEREAMNATQSAGMAVRVVPVITVLHRQKALTDEEFAALSYYRDQAGLADRSPVRSGCDFSVRSGSGNGPGVAIMSAAVETSRMERDMQGLWRLCRAVAVDDVTLERWCIENNGTISPDRLCARGADVSMALLELKYAAGGITVR